MGSRRRQAIPALGGEAVRTTYSTTAATIGSTAVAEHLLRRAPAAGSTASEPLELLPGGHSQPRTGTGGTTARAALDSLAERSRLPAVPGGRLAAALRHVDAHGLDRPGRLPTLPRPTVTTPSTTRARRRRARTTGSTSLGRTYATAVSRAADLNRAAVGERPRTSSLQIQAMIVTAASRYGVDPSLAMAVAYRESGFHQHRVSPANAIGVMQVVPSAGAWASIVVGRRLDLLDVEDNITAGVVLLSCLLATVPEQLAVAGYYQGLTSVHRSGLLPDTRRYVTAVQTLRSRFR
jgi:soluble lytic murein transglycosylase-like protein